MTRDMVRRRPVYRPGLWLLIIGVVIYGVVLGVVSWSRGFWPF